MRLLGLLLGAVCAAAGPHTLSAVKTMSCAGAVCDIVASVDGGVSTAPLRLSFYTPQIVRWWLAVDGNFSDNGAADDVIVQTAVPVSAVLSDVGTYYEVSQASKLASAVVVRVQKQPLLLSILVNGQTVVAEAAPLSWDAKSSWQTLTRDTAPFPSNLTKEWYFGGGMQNGRFSHRDQSINISVDYNWDEGGNPNSAPWYMSSAGYGVLRNTWAPGTYSFLSPVVTSHDEPTRLDAFFLLAGPGPESLKAVLAMYAQLTGPPFLPPLYGLFLGDSDCYHNDRHGNSTRVVEAVAELYVKNDMPGGWFLPNDGYGCGYGEGPVTFPNNLTDLTLVVARLHELGFYTGLWTSTGMPHIAQEVGIAGTRICKTDVGWIGAGYKYAFDGVTLCSVDGIEKYSNGRRFVWTVEGWAGTHRLAVMWTGDNSGSLDYVRWQVPTFVGSGFSAQAHVSGDVDGIFGGSPESQVRDLQFKAFTSVLMVMSGWAPNPDKQPFTWGEPYTSYNRLYLKLKSRLVPYMYSLSREAYDTGVPPVRAPLLEFPGDETLYAATNSTAYQFLSGPSILVAPVFEAGATTRDGVYLPAGADWLGWWDGVRYAGGQTLNAVPAPLATLPLFVRAGAIIPLWPEMNAFNVSATDPMTLELWPAGSTAFSLYEDDGVTRDALPPTNAFSRTAITVVAPPAYLNGSGSAAVGNVTISVGAAQGSFAGQLEARGWWLNVRAPAAPLLVVLAAGAAAPTLLAEAQSEAELEMADSGWFHDPSLQLGLLMVKLPSLPAAQPFTVTLSNGPDYPHIGTETCDTPSHHQVENQRFAFDAASGLITVVPPAAGAGAGSIAGSASDACLTVGADKDPDSHTPALEVQACSAMLAQRQQFALVPASGQITLKSDASSCLDQDASDNRVIVYGCHDPSTPGNQGWKFDAPTQHIVSTENGLCMCVLAQ